MEEIIIFPYSGTAIEALDCLNDNQKCIGFVSDDDNVIGKSFFGIEVYSRTIFDKHPNARVLAVNGSPTSYLKRKEIIDSLKIEKERFCSIIHPKANVSKNATIGYNVLIMGGVVITANANIGNNICILPNSVVHHGSSIGDYTLIAANATICGDVVVEENCYIGAASSIKNGLSIGQNTLVGIGANVVNTIESGKKVVGNPAKEN
jgi:sugar O-acyltransferase (sialic acid O-acetyltransferase NeuD family)